MRRSKTAARPWHERFIPYLFILLIVLMPGCVDLPDPAADEAAGSSSTTTGKGFPSLSARCVVKAWDSKPETGIKPPPAPIASARVHAIESPDLAGLIPSNAQASAVSSPDGVATIETIEPGKIYSLLIDRDGDGVGDHRTFPAMFAEPVDIEVLVYPNSCAAQRWASAQPEREVVNHGDLLRVNLYGYTQGSTHLSAALINGRTGAVLWESQPTQVGGNFEKESFVEIESAWASTAAPSAPSYVLAARLSDDPATGWETMGGSPVVISGTLVGLRGVTEPPSLAPTSAEPADTLSRQQGSPYRVSTGRVSVLVSSPGAWFIKASNDSGFESSGSFRTDGLVSPASSQEEGAPTSSWRLDWDLTPGPGLRSLYVRTGDCNGNLSDPAEISYLVGATGELTPAFTFGIPRYDYNASTLDFAWTLDTPGGRCLLTLYAALPEQAGGTPGTEWPPVERLADLAGESIEIGSGQGHLTIEAHLPHGDFRLMASLYDPSTTVSARVSGPAFVVTVPKPAGSPPTVPAPSSPENGTDCAAASGLIAWTSIDPDGDDLAFDLFLYPEDPTGIEESSLPAPSFEIPAATGLTTATYAYGPLKTGSTWLWRVKATDSEGKTSLSPVFSFKVAQPLAVTVLSPEPGAAVNGEFKVTWNTFGGPSSIDSSSQDASGRTATVEFMRDSGQWITLASGIRDSGEYLLNSKGLANGNGYRIRVRVSSPPEVPGGNPETAFDVTDGTFTVAN